MLSRLKVLVVLFVVAFSMPATAGEVVVVLDVGKALISSKAGESLNGQLDSLREDFQKDISKAEKKLKDKELDLIEKRKNLDDAAFAKARKAFEEEVMAVQKNVQEKKSKIDKRVSEAHKKLKSAMVKATADVSKEGGHRIVLNRSQIIIMDQQLDVTDAVVKKMNKALSKIKL